mmetsp:Transcript_20635/g.57827  ORF Transcript_20635/g.57827 Transcript_20635/m.57827 type:complete len:228 (-) Transcript_20635:609-1292(-)
MHELEAAVNALLSPVSEQVGEHEPAVRAVRIEQNVVSLFFCSHDPQDKPTARLSQAPGPRHGNEVPEWIQGIAISAKTRMLQRRKRHDGIEHRRTPSPHTLGHLKGCNGVNLGVFRYNPPILQRRNPGSAIGKAHSLDPWVLGADHKDMLALQATNTVPNAIGKAVRIPSPIVSRQDPPARLVCPVLYLAHAPNRFHGSSTVITLIHVTIRCFHFAPIGEQVQQRFR